jgi:hypothetical protein
MGDEVPNSAGHSDQPVEEGDDLNDTIDEILHRPPQLFINHVSVHMTGSTEQAFQRDTMAGARHSAENWEARKEQGTIYLLDFPVDEANPTGARFPHCDNDDWFVLNRICTESEGRIRLIVREPTCDNLCQVFQEVRGVGYSSFLLGYSNHAFSQGISEHTGFRTLEWREIAMMLLELDIDHKFAYFEGCGTGVLKTILRRLVGKLCGWLIVFMSSPAGGCSWYLFEDDTHRAGRTASCFLFRRFELAIHQTLDFNAIVNFLDSHVCGYDLVTFQFCSDPKAPRPTLERWGFKLGATTIVETTLDQWIEGDRVLYEDEVVWDEIPAVDVVANPIPAIAVLSDSGSAVAVVSDPTPAIAVVSDPTPAVVTDAGSAVAVVADAIPAVAVLSDPARAVRKFRPADGETFSRSIQLVQLVPIPEQLSDLAKCLTRATEQILGKPPAIRRWLPPSAIGGECLKVLAENFPTANPKGSMRELSQWDGLINVFEEEFAEDAPMRLKEAVELAKIELATREA